MKISVTSKRAIYYGGVKWVIINYRTPRFPESVESYRTYESHTACRIHW